MKPDRIGIFTAVYTAIFLISFLYAVIPTAGVPYYRGTEDKKVAAFYYGWYSNTSDYTRENPYNITDDNIWRHWNLAERGWYPPVNACSTHTPIFGWYDSADPQLIEKHLKMAEWAGLDAFICSYWGNTSVSWRNFLNMLEVARYINTTVKLTIYFEIFQKGLDKMPVQDAVNYISGQLRYLYGVFTDEKNKPYIWYEKELPVIFVYVYTAVDSAVWNGVFDNLTSEGIEFFIVADRPSGDYEYNRDISGIHSYDIYACTRDNRYKTTFFGLKTISARFGHVFAAGVFPGYNDTVVRDGNIPYPRNNGDTYRQSWENALSLNPDWITITSWNEWHEGTEIEPSIENGDIALNQTRDFIQKFKSGDYRIDNTIVVSIYLPGIVSVVITVTLSIALLIFNIDIAGHLRGLRKSIVISLFILGILLVGLSLAALIYLIEEVIPTASAEVFTGPYIYLAIPAVVFFYMGTSFLELYGKRKKANGRAK